MGGGKPGEDAGMVEFEMEDSWEEFVSATMDEELVLLETGQDKPVPGMVVETDPWGDSGRHGNRGGS